MIRNKRKVIPVFIKSNKKIKIFSGLTDEINRGDTLVFLKVKEFDFNVVEKQVN